MVSRSPRPRRDGRTAPMTGSLPVPICALPCGCGLGSRAECPPLSWALAASKPMPPPAPRRYLCCETQMELREWFATFLFMQVPGAGCRVWGGSGEASITKNGRVCSLVKPPVASGF